MNRNDFLALASKAIHEAVEENTRLGLPNVFSLNGKLVYQLPNGDVVMHYDWSQHKQFKNSKKKEKETII